MDSNVKNLLGLLAVIFIFALIFANNADEKSVSDKNVIKLDAQLSTYLITESQYKNNFSDDKNVVFYGEECSCPYSQKFVSKIEKLIDSGLYKKHYVFVKMSNNMSFVMMKDKDYNKFLNMKKENPDLYNNYLNQGMSPIEDILPESKGRRLNEFYKKCNVFCIVNSTGDRMVKFGGVGNKEIDQLDEILDKYNNSEW